MITIIRFLDKIIGTILCYFFGMSALWSKKNVSDPKNILVIQLWGIGETILTLPAIKELQKKFKKSNITILCTKRNADVYTNQGVKINVISLNPFVVKWYTLTHWRKYDLVVDMEEYLNISALISFFVGKFRIGYDHGPRRLLYNNIIPYNDSQHVSQTFMDLLKPLGIQKKASTLIPVYFSKKDSSKVKKLLPKGKVIAISAGAAESSKMRMWPEQKWATFIDEMNKTSKVSFVLLGAPDIGQVNKNIMTEVDNNKNITDLAGKTSVTELFALCKQVDLMISIDSGPMHIAAAQGTKTIGLFGPNTPVRFAPLGKKCISIYKPVAEPIINVHKGEVPTSDDPKWMSKITVKDVLKAVDKML